jgi:cysteinyl-tRNA synthetase, unknown class
MKTKTFIFFTILLASCKEPEGNLSPQRNSFQEEMRSLVQNLSKNAKSTKANFLIIPQNGLELLKNNKEASTSYLKAIDGIATESLFYGYYAVDLENTVADINYFQSFLSTETIGAKPVLAIDYCATDNSINSSISKNTAKNNKLYLTNNKSLSQLPNPNIPLLGENKMDIAKIEDAKNFMVMTSLNGYSKDSVLENIAKTNFDAVIINGFYQNNLLTDKEIKSLKIKKNGGKRLVLAQIDIAVADTKKYYWRTDWSLNLPNFVNKQIGVEGNFRANYWQNEWQNILSGNENSLISKFIKLGFDGAYLTGTEAYVWYE